jgi:hypothetical protein
MVCYTDTWSNTTRHYSNDGGDSWAEVKFDNTLATLPYNRRDGVWVWHPTDASTLFGIGGDWITRSTDAGKTLAWYANGYNGIMLGGMFNFSPTSPDTVALFFQDYNGAFTLDGGKTWNYRDVSGKGWGGYCYGGYAVDCASDVGRRCRIVGRQTPTACVARWRRNMAIGQRCIG